MVKSQKSETKKGTENNKITILTDTCKFFLFTTRFPCISSLLSPFPIPSSHLKPRLLQNWSWEREAESSRRREEASMVTATDDSDSSGRIRVRFASQSHPPLICLKYIFPKSRDDPSHFFFNLIHRTFISLLYTILR